MAADRIVAQPGTITASIGVLAGKFVTKGFWDMVGLTSDPVQRGRHATYFSSEQAYTDEERALFKGWLQRVYKDFVGKVAQGRNKTFDEVHAIAQGRIWTGEDALKLGLVDELGGLPEAIAAAKKLAHIGEKESIDLVEVPEPKSFLESFFERDDQSTTGLDRFQTQVRSFIETGRLPGGDDVLSMPYVPDVR
jgi:protease-4